MSGYLTRLVDRAAAPPAAAVSPRVGPVFPVRPPAPGGDPAVVAPRDGDDVQTSHAEGPTLGRGRAARPDGSPAPMPSRDFGAPTDVPSPVAVAPVAAERKPVEARADPSPLPEPDAVTSIDVRVEQASTPRSEPPAQEAAALVVALPRPAAPDALRAPRPQGAPVPRERPPRIEVRIGRVEIRRPTPPEPVEWPAAAPAPADQVGGFGELAAARRYLDRRWS